VPARSDATSRLTEAQVCEIAGTSQQRRQQWVKRGWLRRAGGAGCGLVDALELVQLKALIDVLGPTDGPIAWLQVRADLEQPFPADPFDVIFDAQIKHAAVARADSDLRAMISHSRPIRVVPLARARAQTTEAFRRLLRWRRRALAVRRGSDEDGQGTRPAERRFHAAFLSPRITRRLNSARCGAHRSTRSR
jgi:hypothetical protein